MTPFFRTAGALLLLGLASSACGDGPSDDPGPVGGDPQAEWRTSSDPVDRDPLVWLADTTVHLADGSTIELAAPTEDFVLAGDGVFSIADGSEDDGGSGVLFTAPGSESVETGLDLYPESLQASDDGRYLAGVDRSASDQEDQFGTPLATVVVLDLETGEQVVASTDGMGDVGSDDLADLYSESEIGPLAFVGDAVVVRTAEGGDLAWDLDTGESREPRAGEEIPAAPQIGSEEALTSPDGRWRIVQGEELADTLEPLDGGRTVTPDPGTGRWALQFWADESTAVGTAVDGPGGPTRIEPADSQTLMSCTVPSGDCELYDESTDRDVTFPQDAGSSAVGLALSGEPS